jgi:hypothetical protein
MFWYSYHIQSALWLNVDIKIVFNERGNAYDLPLS